MWITTGRGKSSGLLAIHSSGQTISSLAHIEGITLSAGEEVDEVAGGADADRIGEIGDRASEGQAAGVYGTGFTGGFLTRKGARVGTRVTGNNFISDKELMKVGRIAEGN